MTSPLSRAWATLTRYPLLALIPVLWEAALYGVALGLGDLPHANPSNTFSLKLLLPPPLPSGSELISQTVPLHFRSFTGQPLVPMLIGTILGAVVTAGYLHLLHRALAGEAPSWRGFAEGASRCGPRLLLWSLLSTVILLAVLMLTGGIPMLAMMITMLLSLLYFPAPFLIVVMELGIPKAVTSTPRILSAHLRALAPVCIAALLLSGACSITLTVIGLGLGPGTLLLASPVWGWFGTWVALGVLAVLQAPQRYA